MNDLRQEAQQQPAMAPAQANFVAVALAFVFRGAVLFFEYLLTHGMTVTTSIRLQPDEKGRRVLKIDNKFRWEGFSLDGQPVTGFSAVPTGFSAVPTASATGEKGYRVTFPDDPRRVS